MKIINNVHQRELRTSSDRVGKLIDSLSSKKDALWPRQCWPAMEFHKDLRVGASGGHGPIRYLVDKYRPGEYIEFRFISPTGFDGFHSFEWEQKSAVTVVLRHSVKMRIFGRSRIIWPLIFEPLHNALIEDCLAKAQVSLGLDPTVKSWSLWVKTLRWIISGGKRRRQVI